MGEAQPSTMSKFNVQTICMKCKDIESEHRDYKKACEAEEADLRKTLAAKVPNNFPGIGLPGDLRSKMVRDVIKSEVYDTLFTGALWGMNEGYYEIDDTEIGDACAFCKEETVEQSLRVSDVEEVIYLCLPCGIVLAEHFSSVLFDASHEATVTAEKMRETLAKIKSKKEPQSAG